MAAHFLAPLPSICYAPFTMQGINLYKEVPCGTPEEFNVVVEVVKGTTNKIEYDEKGGYFKLDRVLHQPTFYPFDYGFIPQTHSGDGDAMDVCLLLTFPSFPGCVVKARAIGVIHTADQDGTDDKIIAVPVSKVDPRFNELTSFDQLPAHVREEFMIYFKEYKKLEKKKYDKIEIKGVSGPEVAREEIKKAMESFANEHGNA